ncbi:hypothetical protein K8T06_05215 [bacterium]|nr:hypothetical protein [bacterium]
MSRGLSKRSELRRLRIKTHRATNYKDADLWDLQFWQEQSPEDRLSALVAIRRDVEKVLAAKKVQKL